MPRVTRAGPGQKPAMPQPAPKSRLPTIRRLSISFFVGSRIAPPKKFIVRLRAKRKATSPTKMAPAITKASEGSHRPEISRKPITLEGSVIPAKIKPMPKIRPTINDDAVSKCVFIECSYSISLNVMRLSAGDASQTRWPCRCP